MIQKVLKVLLMEGFMDVFLSTSNILQVERMDICIGLFHVSGHFGIYLTLVMDFLAHTPSKLEHSCPYRQNSRYFSVFKMPCVVSLDLCQEV